MSLELVVLALSENVDRWTPLPYNTPDSSIIKSFPHVINIQIVGLCLDEDVGGANFIHVFQRTGSAHLMVTPLFETPHFLCNALICELLDIK